MIKENFRKDSLATEQEELFSSKLQREIRSRFTGFEDHRLFFNNAAGALRLKSVLELQRHLTAIPDYPGKGSPPAAELLAAVEQGQKRLRQLLAAPPEGSLVQDLTASRLLFSLIAAAARNCRGRRLLVTALDHPAAIDGTRQAAADTGKTALIVPADQDNHSIRPSDILERLDQDTGLLVLTYTSNSTGTVLPAAEISQAARQKNPDIFIILDAVQRAPHGPVGLKNLPVDAAVIAPYKLFSARGSGLAWISPRLAGAGGECLLDQSPSWELGSIDPLSFSLMGPVGDYFLWLGRHFAPAAGEEEAIQIGLSQAERQEQNLLGLLLEGFSATTGQDSFAIKAQGLSCPGLRHLPGIRLFFDQPKLTGRDLILSFSLPHLRAEEAYKRFLHQGIITSLRLQDSIYCGSLLKDYGIPWLLRISPMHYHDAEDIRRFLLTAAQIASEA